MAYLLYTTFISLWPRSKSLLKVKFDVMHPFLSKRCQGGAFVSFRLNSSSLLIHGEIPKLALNVGKLFIMEHRVPRTEWYLFMYMTMIALISLLGIVIQDVKLIHLMIKSPSHEFVLVENMHGQYKTELQIWFLQNMMYIVVQFCQEEQVTDNEKKLL